MNVPDKIRVMMDTRQVIRWYPQVRGPADLPAGGGRMMGMDASLISIKLHFLASFPH